MFREEVELEVDSGSRDDRFQARDLVGVGNDPEDKAVLVQLRHRQADAIDADGSLVNHEVGELRRKGDGETVILSDFFIREHFRTRIDMTLHKVSAEPVADAKGTLEIDGITGLQFAQIREPQRLMQEIKSHRPVFHLGHGETGSVIRDTLTQGHFFDKTRSDPELRTGLNRLEADDLATFFNDPCEHRTG